MLLRSGFLALAVLTVAAGTQASAQTRSLPLEGRWTNNGDCGKWVQFRKQGSSWTYAEARLNRGKVYPATVSTGADGTVTARMHLPEAYEYVNKFNGNDSFTAIEGFNDGPLNGRRKTLTYTRCS